MNVLSATLLTACLLTGLSGCGLAGIDLLDPFGGATYQSLGPPGDAMTDSEYAMARDVYQRANAERAARGVPPLQWDPTAAHAAFEQCVDMRVNDYYAHFNKDGVAALDRVRAAGIDYGMAGENIWMQYEPGVPQQAVDAWMGSSGHRGNLLDAHFSHTGVGVHTDGKNTWWVQVFYTP